MPPASPASPPESAIVRTTVPEIEMPAYRAALGLRPTVRIANPMVLRNRSHHEPTASSNARISPQ